MLWKNKTLTKIYIHSTMYLCVNEVSSLKVKEITIMAWKNC